MSRLGQSLERAKPHGHKPIYNFTHYSYTHKNIKTEHFN